jgi:ATP-dependent Clp protease ATP-binding subunit ClpB
MSLSAPREWLADQGYSEVYGARAVARVVRTKVLFPLAKKLLTGTIRCEFILTPFPPPLKTDTHCSEGDIVKIDHEAQSDDLVVKDNHTPDTTVSSSLVSLSL